MDVDKAFEALNGFDVKTDEDTDGPFYTGGPSDPTGLDLPVRTFYVQNEASTPVKIWLKFNTGVNDWRQLDAIDIPYDPTGFLNFEPTDTDVKKALDKFGALNLADLTELEAFNDDSTSSTTTNGWSTKHNITTVGIKTAGTFSITHSAQIGQSDKEKQVGYRAQWKADSSGTWITLADVRNGLGTDDGYELRTGINIVTLASDDQVDIRQQFGQTDDGGTGRSRFNSIVIQRVGD